MKLIKNSGNDRVIDELRRCLTPQGILDIASPTFSLFAFGEIQELLSKLAKCRLLVLASGANDLALIGTDSDRTCRNRLQLRWPAKQCATWIEAKADVKNAPGVIPQATATTAIKFHQARGDLARFWNAWVPAIGLSWMTRQYCAARLQIIMLSWLECALVLWTQDEGRGKNNPFEIAAHLKQEV
jgi:hypothetical protein